MVLGSLWKDKNLQYSQRICNSKKKLNSCPKVTNSMTQLGSLSLSWHYYLTQWLTNHSEVHEICDIPPELKDKTCEQNQETELTAQKTLIKVVLPVAPLRSKFPHETASIFCGHQSSAFLVIPAKPSMMPSWEGELVRTNDINEDVTFQKLARSFLHLKTPNSNWLPPAQFEAIPGQYMHPQSFYQMLGSNTIHRVHFPGKKFCEDCNQKIQM